MRQYPLARPFLDKREEREVLKVLRSGNLSLGGYHREFEFQFAKKIGTKYACAVSSGTAGLHLAMISGGIGAGDEVITSPFSFISSANCILYVGAKPVFVDIDSKTYNIDPDKIEKKITRRTKAILVVHIFGQAAAMDPILRIARKHGLKIIEDACESVCAEYKGKNAGTFGECAVFAFYPNKQMTTGEGGMIATDSKKIYEICKSLSNQGRTPNLQWLDHKYLGYNYRMDEMSAAVGLVQLKKLDYMIEKRKKIAQYYNKCFENWHDLVQIPYLASENSHTWFVYVVQIKNKKTDRDGIIQKLSKAGISTKGYLPSIHLFDFYKKKFGYKKGDFPISESVSRHSLALPFYLDLTEDDAQYISDRVIRAIKAV